MEEAFGRTEGGLLANEDVALQYGTNVVKGGTRQKQGNGGVSLAGVGYSRGPFVPPIE